MATDGVSLFYNPQFVEQLPPAELVGVLAYEVMHPALHHDNRRGDRSPKRRNEACDYAINPLLMEAGLQLPSDRLFDPRFRGMSAEQIYNLLDQEKDKQQPESNTGDDQQDRKSAEGQPSSDNGSLAPETSGGFGQVLDAPQYNDDEPADQPINDKESHERNWQIAVEQAETIARLAGKTPAGLERSLETGERASVDWREALRRTFTETLPADYTWMRPNRHHLWKGLYLPGIMREGVGEIAIAVDCSGSISRRVLGLFQAEVNALISEHLPERIHVCYFDARIHRHDIVEGGQAVALNPIGGGGTDFAPVFAHFEERGIEPHALTVLTDLFGTFPPARAFLSCDLGLDPA
jgi:predicted metal-dependent peptidase